MYKIVYIKIGSKKSNTILVGSLASAKSAFWDMIDKTRRSKKYDYICLRNSDDKTMIDFNWYVIKESK